jgi:CheY-like chemotaxis protein
MAKKILIIDDDSDDRELFREALEAIDPSVGFNFTADAEDALSKLKAGAMAFPDIIFLDINLPGMSGWQCLTELKNIETLRHIPVMMYSTSNHRRDKDIAVDLGAVCLITKPMTYKRLKEILAVLLEFSKEGRLASFCNEMERMQDN